MQIAHQIIKGHNVVNAQVQARRVGIKLFKDLIEVTFRLELHWPSAFNLLEIVYPSLCWHDDRALSFYLSFLFPTSLQQVGIQTFR